MNRVSVQGLCIYKVRGGQAQKSQREGLSKVRGRAPVKSKRRAH